MSTRKTIKYGPHPVDVYVGRQVRQRRTLLGMSQEQVGEALGLTFQQVQKYERGANRISASRLFELSKILDMPVSFFFEDMPKTLNALSRDGVTEKDQETDPMTKRETLEFVRAYYRIQDPAVRRCMLELVGDMAISSN